MLTTLYKTKFLSTKDLPGIQMAVSQQVQEAIDDAARSLREGLAFAARSESAMVVQALGEQITRLEHLGQLDELITKFEIEMKDKRK